MIPRAARIGLVGAFVVLALVAAVVYLVLRASLPTLDGETHLPGLGAEVTVDRDALGERRQHAPG